MFQTSACMCIICMRASERVCMRVCVCVWVRPYVGMWACKCVPRFRSVCDKKSINFVLVASARGTGFYLSLSTAYFPFLSNISFKSQQVIDIPPPVKAITHNARPQSRIPKTNQVSDSTSTYDTPRKPADFLSARVCNVGGTWRKKLQNTQQEGEQYRPEHLDESRPFASYLQAAVTEQAKQSISLEDTARPRGCACLLPGGR